MKSFNNEFGYNVALDDSWEKLSDEELQIASNNPDCIDFYFNALTENGVGVYHEGNIYLNTMSGFFKYALEKLQDTGALVSECQMQKDRMYVTYTMDNEVEYCCYLRLSNIGHLGKVVSSDKSSLDEVLDGWSLCQE